MINFLKSFFDNDTFDRYIEGVYAHQYKDEKTRQEIFQRYNIKYKPEPSPFTHPENYDPLNPPIGWAYDPYYEIWIKTNES